MFQTEKNIVFLGIGGGTAMFIGAFILFLQNQTLKGFQFHTTWSGVGANRVTEGTLSWQGLVFLGIICMGMGIPFLFNKKENSWEDE